MGWGCQSQVCAHTASTKIRIFPACLVTCAAHRKGRKRCCTQPCKSNLEKTMFPWGEVWYTRHTLCSHPRWVFSGVLFYTNAGLMLAYSWVQHTKISWESLVVRLLYKVWPIKQTPTQNLFFMRPSSKGLWPATRHRFGGSKRTCLLLFFYPPGAPSPQYLQLISSYCCHSKSNHTVRLSCWITVSHYSCRLTSYQSLLGTPCFTLLPVGWLVYVQPTCKITYFNPTPGTGLSLLIYRCTERRVLLR